MATGSVFEGGGVTGDVIALFLVQLLLIVIFSRIIGFLLTPLKQPQVVAEVIAGLILGPSALCSIPAFKDTIFPEGDSVTVLNVVSNFGLMLFMFVVGLELDPTFLARGKRSSLLISLTGIALPFALGCAVSLLLYNKYPPANVSYASFLLFIGCAMSITAFPVLARILSERKLLATTVGVICMGAAAIDDIVAWCILALVVAVVRASDYLVALWSTMTAIAFIIFLAKVVRPLMLRFARRMMVNSHLSSHMCSFFLVGALISAWITDIIGIHAIFGAFAFGIMVPREHSIHRLLCEKIEDLVVTIMLPLYFTYSGLRTVLNNFDAEAGALLVLVTVVAIVGKFGGCTIAAKLAGWKWRQSCTVGVLMNTKGLVELVVLNLGLDYNVLTTELFSIFVVMALITTFLTSPIVFVIYGPKHMASDAAELQALVDVEHRDERFSILACVNDQRTSSIINVAAGICSSKNKERAIYALRLTPLSDRVSSYMSIDGPSSNEAILAGVSKLS
eukprot:GILJ01007757.1.p1 GENE.GILJ01007757.1~~GILJ01007757.1.p1  ORF type:complete len:506 (+),score=37.99 GILJ01007757.1:1043-2560(+)